MTFDVPTAVLTGGVLSALGAATAWVARTMVFDRLTALEGKHASSATRFGEGDHALDKKLAVLEERISWLRK